MATEKVLTIGATGIEEKIIDTGSGGGSSVTKDSFLAKFRAFELINAAAPGWYDKDVGFAGLGVAGGVVNTSGTGKFSYIPFIASAAGTDSSYTGTSLVTGTTASGNAYIAYTTALDAYGPARLYSIRSESEDSDPSLNPTRKIIFTGAMGFSAAADATNTFQLDCILGGYAPSLRWPTPPLTEE